jgi:hypothetical protein
LNNWRFVTAGETVDRTHLVEPGETLESIAQWYGLSGYRAIYNHPDNASFRLHHPDPKQIQEGELLRVYDAHDPLQPYGSLSPTSTMHWHYIFPDPNHDASGQPWSAKSLKAAVLSGNAAVLSIGQILMLAGDFFGEFEDMEQPKERERPPVHIKPWLSQPAIEIVSLSFSKIERPVLGGCFKKHIRENLETSRPLPRYDENTRLDRRLTWVSVMCFMTFFTSDFGICSATTQFSEIDVGPAYF